MNDFFNSQVNSSKLVIRVMGLNKIYSLDYNPSWTVRQLGQLLRYIFKEENKKNTISILYNGKAVEINEVLLEDLFRDKKDLPTLFIMFKPSNSTDNYQDLANKPKKQIFETDIFEIIEKGFLYNYKNSIGNPLTLNSYLNKMPLFHPQIKSRYADIAEKNLETYENQVIENFPIRNYVKFTLIFKLFLMFLLFGFGMKGLNFPIFIALLVIYYW
jgi:hypothetical protein